MKIDRHGQAKILTQTEIQLLFSQGLQNNRDRALFGICLYCCCRINIEKTSDRTKTFLAGEYGKHFLVGNYFDCVGNCVDYLVSQNKAIKATSE